MSKKKKKRRELPIEAEKHDDERLAYLMALFRLAFKGSK